MTETVPEAVRPGSGQPLFPATPTDDKRMRQLRFSYELFPDPDRTQPEIHWRPWRVWVRAISGSLDGKAGSDDPRAEVEIVSTGRWLPSPEPGLPRVQENTVLWMSVRVGESIWHDNRAYRVLKIVPPQKIAGVGNLIGWIEVDKAE